MQDEHERESAEVSEPLNELASLRAHHLEEAAEIARLQSDALETRGIERAQRALIARLRQDAGGADERLQQVRDRLARAESELSDL